MAAFPGTGMTVADARRVRWLSTDPRPLGELLDEGFLTQRRLEWAAENAYNATLKEAAQVLLDALHRSPSAVQKSARGDSVPEPVMVNMSVETARATVWPFKELRGQTLGALLDSKQLSLKDLGFAAENAKDIRVRNAAVTLTLSRLNHIVQEPDEPAGHIKVVSGGRSYSLR